MSEMIQFNSIEGVIFAVEDLESQRECVPFSGEFWTPTRAEAIALEEKLPNTLTELLGEKYGDFVFYEFSTYIRQYVGVTIAGEKCIWVNCFCALFSYLPDYWHFIMDGANPCYLRLIWHPGSQTFSNFTSYDSY